MVNTGAGSLSANVEQLDAFVNKAKGYYDDIQAQVKFIWEGKVMAGETWQGDAKQAFDVLMDRYASSAEKLSDKLLQTTESIAASSKEYEAQDQIFKDQVNKAVASLDLPPV